MGAFINISTDDLRKRIWCPAINEIFHATKSRVIAESDDVSVQIKLANADRVWLRYKLRDRRFDGPGWKGSPLTDWTYGGADDVFPFGSAVEESIYCLDPRYPLTDAFTARQAQFITNPFEELPYSNPTKDALSDWFRRWQEIVNKNNVPYPGYFYLNNIPGVRRYVHENITVLLKEKGYKYLTAVPTWWHTARICAHLGFVFQCEEDELVIDKLNTRLNFSTKEECARSSWIVMLQFWVELVCGAGFSLSEDFPEAVSLVLRDERGAHLTFPLSPQRNLWLNYKI